ncbi:NADH dehydrogenase (ubiquinone) complex I, assembly factor 6 homolog [Anopheles bellator]|uniref:NADH dehydrogenase (ubiquinone) complex I, assembly factor 6 homolog n=1 Tax=Anopheles bellator TaxID=139047 RepID=UPI002648D782|nr:NADH dehydrogenase (ubiquinone) complex I, assembly factor 6 homolog [Anopheles bellator]
MLSISARNMARLKRTDVTREVASSAKSSPQTVCLDIVRRHDKENFLCTLLLQNPQRRSALAVRAFNVEVAKVGEKARSGNISAMPLKFWDETIADLYRKNGRQIPQQPVISELASAINHHRLSKMHFQRLVRARMNTKLNFVSVKQLEDYAEQSVSSVLYLLLEMHETRNTHCDHAASHLGKAQGIVNLLRSIPYQARHNMLPVPQELLISHGVSQERMIRNGRDDPGVKEVTFSLASVAHQHLAKAKTLMETLPRQIKPIFLPGVVVERFLNRLRLADFDISNPRVTQTDSLLPLVLYWRKFRGHI